MKNPTAAQALKDPAANDAFERAVASGFRMAQARRIRARLRRTLVLAERAWRKRA